MRFEFLGAAWSRFRADILLASVVLAIFIANAAVSLGVESGSGWQDDPLRGYSVNLALSLVGLYLLFPPFVILEDVIRQGSLPASYYYAGLGWWALGVVALVLIATRAPLPLWRRAIFAYLVGAQLAGFAAVHWSTLGN